MNFHYPDDPFALLKKISIASQSDRPAPGTGAADTSARNANDQKNVMASLSGRCHLHAHQIIKDQHHQVFARGCQRQPCENRLVMPDKQESAAIK
jgi:hypothetical protein